MKIIFKILDDNKWKKQMGDDFIDWAENYLSSPELAGERNKMIRIMFDRFKSENRERRRFTGLSEFQRKLKMFLIWKRGVL
jgi:hypothetical protein